VSDAASGDSRPLHQWEVDVLQGKADVLERLAVTRNAEIATLRAALVQAREVICRCSDTYAPLSSIGIGKAMENSIAAIDVALGEEGK
jgi:hypothetical protein